MLRSALPVLNARKQLTPSDTIAAQLFVTLPLVLQSLQQPLEEALHRLGIALGLNQDVEHNAILIDGAPEIMLYALDPDEDLAHVPLVAWLWVGVACRSVKWLRCVKHNCYKAYVTRFKDALDRYNSGD